MYNDEENNISRPRFDAKTGEKIIYPDANETNTSGTSQGTTDTQYRYSGNNIPYNNSNASDYSGTGNNNTSNAGYNNAGYNNAQNMGYNNYAGAGYTNNYMGSAATQNTTPQSGTPKKPKKPLGQSFKKFCQVKMVRRVAAALLCGVIAGGAMLGTYYAGISIFPASAARSNYEIATVTSNVSTGTAVKTENDTANAAGGMDVSTVASAALPAMVALTGTTTVSSSSSSSYYGMFGGSQSYEAATSGTGIIVGKNDTELLILTNAHVIEDVNNLTCVFVDEQQVNATVKGSKSDKDIAVVAVSLADISSDTLGKIAIAELGDSDEATVGQQVVAIGNALGEGQSVTTGIISALNRSITVNSVTFTGLMMTDAAINSGNSGGALLDENGKVIAINFAKTSEDGVEGMAYSIPVSNVRELIDSLMNKETRNKVSDDKASFLGLSAVDITSSLASTYGYPQGVMIRSVTSGSAAEKAGLGAYDILVSFDDQSITSFSSLQSTMLYYAAGETVTIEYYHMDGSQYVLKSVEVTLDKKN